MTTLLDEQGLTSEEFQQALQAAYEAALQKAVADGVITQEQADQLLSQQDGCFRMPGLPGMDGRKHGGPEGFGGFERFRNPPGALDSESEL